MDDRRQAKNGIKQSAATFAIIETGRRNIHIKADVRSGKYRLYEVRFGDGKKTTYRALSEPVLRGNYFDNWDDAAAALYFGVRSKQGVFKRVKRFG